MYINIFSDLDINYKINGNEIWIDVDPEIQTIIEGNKMESDFFEMYNSQLGLSLELGHNSVADWVLVVRDKKDVEVGNIGKQVLHVQHCDRKKVFAEAYHLLSEYLSDNRGGY